MKKTFLLLHPKREPVAYLDSIKKRERPLEDVTVHLQRAANRGTIESIDRRKSMHLAEVMRKRTRSLISNGDLRKAEGIDTQAVVGEERGVHRNDARVDEGIETPPDRAGPGAGRECFEPQADGPDIGLI